MPDSVFSTIRRNAFNLGILALAAALVLGLVQRATSDLIREQQEEAERRALGEIFPNVLHDNDLLGSRFLISPLNEEFDGLGLLGLSGNRNFYLATLNGRLTGVVLPVEAHDGYSGDILMLAGILIDGRITGVRVIRHDETPGLGDKIDIAVDDWILGFDGRSLGNPVDAGWGIRPDGGEFDSLVGATITPRAVVRAVHQALQFLDRNRERLRNLR